MDNKTQSIRVRIAPSPTGNLHVGTARSALFNELFAKHHHGVFIVRIEDTDIARSKSEYEASILEGLAWLGLTWQEGPDIGGEYGPYRQSERKELYKKALTTLLEEGKAYPCSCKKKEKDASPCTCSSTATKPYDPTLPIKLKVQPGIIAFNDLIRGKVEVHTDTFGGDFIIARSSTDPLFHLAVVIDDAEMHISHVIRGEDHISNTAKHILIQQALGYAQPTYAHIPLLLDEQKKKLSKRSGETNLLAYREIGFLPQAMLNYLALLGWNPGDDREIFSHKELAEEFSIERVQKGGAVFSIQKLTSMNKYYIRSLSQEELLQVAAPFLPQEAHEKSFEVTLKKALTVEQERIETLAQLKDILALYLPSWQASYEPSLLVWKKSTTEKTKDLLQKLIEKTLEISENNFTVEGLQKLFIEWIDSEDLGRGDTLWPMRVALSGKENSASPFEIAFVIGKENTLKRLEEAHKNLAS